MVPIAFELRAWYELQLQFTNHYFVPTSTSFASTSHLLTYMNSQLVRIRYMYVIRMHCVYNSFHVSHECKLVNLCLLISNLCLFTRILILFYCCTQISNKSHTYVHMLVTCVRNARLFLNYHKVLLLNVLLQSRDISDFPKWRTSLHCRHHCAQSKYGLIVKDRIIYPDIL